MTFNSSLFSGLEGGPLRADIELLECATRAGANHGDMTVVTTVDGGSRLMTCDVDHNVWKAMCGIGDRQSLNLDTERPQLLGSTPIGGEQINISIKER